MGSGEAILPWRFACGVNGQTITLFTHTMSLYSTDGNLTHELPLEHVGGYLNEVFGLKYCPSDC
jgi:hypothetical protein